MAVDYSALDKEFRDSKTNIDKHLPRILEEIKKDQGDFMEECISVIEDMVDVAEKKKNKHEKLFVEICVESIKKNHKRYYRLLKCVLQEKNVVKWKGHEEGMKQMVEILEQPIEWTPTKDSDEKEPSRTDIGRMVEDVVEKMLTACERDKILKKMSSPFAHLLTRCIKSAAPMHMVVAKAIVDFYELGWKDIPKQIPELLDAFGEWIEKADLVENDDNIRVVEMLSNWPVMNSVP